MFLHCEGFFLIADEVMVKVPLSTSPFEWNNAETTNTPEFVVKTMRSVGNLSVDTGLGSGSRPLLPTVSRLHEYEVKTAHTLQDVLESVVAELSRDTPKQPLQVGARLKEAMKTYRKQDREVDSSVYRACADMCTMLHLQITLEKARWLYVKVPPTAEGRRECYRLLEYVTKEHRPPKKYSPAADLSLSVRKQLEALVPSYVDCLNLFAVLNLNGTMQGLTRTNSTKHAEALFQEAISYGDDASKCAHYHLAKMEFNKCINCVKNRAKVVGRCRKYAKKVAENKDGVYFPGAAFYMEYLQSTKGCTRKPDYRHLRLWCKERGKSYQYYLCKFKAQASGDDEEKKERIYTRLLKKDGKFQDAVGGCYREQKTYSYLGASQAKLGKISEAVENLLIGMRVAGRTVWDGFTRVVVLILQAKSKGHKVEDKVLLDLHSLYRPAIEKSSSKSLGVVDLGEIVAGVIDGGVATGSNPLSVLKIKDMSIFFEGIDDVEDMSKYVRYCLDLVNTKLEEKRNGVGVTEQEDLRLPPIIREFKALRSDIKRFYDEQKETLQIFSDQFPHIQVKRLILRWHVLEKCRQNLHEIKAEHLPTEMREEWDVVGVCMSILYSCALSSVNFELPDQKICKVDFDEPMGILGDIKIGGEGEIHPVVMREVVGEYALRIGPSCMGEFLARNSTVVRGVPMIEKLPKLCSNADVYNTLNSNVISGHCKEVSIYKDLGFHPNIARTYIYESGASQIRFERKFHLYARNEGVDVLTMVMRDAEDGWSGLSPEWIVRILVQVLRGLKHVHAKGVVHGDLKVNNIVINSAGRVRIIDFGCGSKEGSDKYTRDDRYPYEKICFGSDMWAVGLMICNLLVHPDGEHRMLEGRGVYVHKKGLHRAVTMQLGREYYEEVSDPVEEVSRLYPDEVGSDYMKNANTETLYHYLGVNRMRVKGNTYFETLASNMFRECAVEHMKACDALNEYGGVVDHVQLQAVLETANKDLEGATREMMAKVLRQKNARAYFANILIECADMCLKSQLEERPSASELLEHLRKWIPNFDKIMDTVDSGGGEV